MLRIVKNPNGKMKVKKIEMSCDTSLCKLNEPFNYNSFILIVGLPRSGKTNLIINIIHNKEMLGKKFNNVYIWSPSLHTIKKKIKVKKDRIFSEFNLDEITDVLNEVKNNFIENSSIRTLFIFDDMNTKFSKKQKDIIYEMIYNRRQSGLTILMTTQFYKVIPPAIRSVCSSIIIFKLSLSELEKVHKDMIPIDNNKWTNITNRVFDEPHNFLFFNKDTNKYYRNFDEIIFNE